MDKIDNNAHIIGHSVAGIDYRSVDKKRVWTFTSFLVVRLTGSLVFVSSEIDVEIYGVPA